MGWDRERDTVWRKKRRARQRNRQWWLSFCVLSSEQRDRGRRDWVGKERERYGMEKEEKSASEKQAMVAVFLSSVF